MTAQRPSEMRGRRFRGKMLGPASGEGAGARCAAAAASEIVARSDVAAASAIVSAAASGVESSIALTPAIDSNPQVAPLKSAANKRKYRDQDSMHDVEVVEHLCVKGGRLQEFHALPVKRIDGQLFVRIGSKESWVCQVFAGRVVTNEMYSGVRFLKAHIRDLRLRQELAAQKEAVERASAGRAGLALHEICLDSENEQDAAVSPAEQVAADSLEAEQLPTASKRQRQRRAAGDVFAIDLRGLSIKCVFVQQSLYIEANAPAVKAVMDQLRVLLVPVQVRGARQLLSASVPRSSPTATTGKVCLLKGRYAVTYRDLSGARRQATQGLHIKTKDQYGNRITGEAYAAELERVRGLAIELWNELDRSDAPRIPQDSCQLVLERPTA